MTSEEMVLLSALMEKLTAVNNTLGSIEDPRSTEFLDIYETIRMDLLHVNLAFSVIMGYVKNTYETVEQEDNDPEDSPPPQAA